MVFIIPTHCKIIFLYTTTTHQQPRPSLPLHNFLTLTRIPPYKMSGNNTSRSTARSSGHANMRERMNDLEVEAAVLDTKVERLEAQLHAEEGISLPHLLPSHTFCSRIVVLTIFIYIAERRRVEGQRNMLYSTARDNAGFLNPGTFLPSAAAPHAIIAVENSMRPGEAGQALADGRQATTDAIAASSMYFA